MYIKLFFRNLAMTVTHFNAQLFLCNINQAEIDYILCIKMPISMAGNMTSIADQSHC